MNGVDERHAVAVEITVEGEAAKPGIDEHLALLALLQFPHLRRGAAIGLFGKEVSAVGGSGIEDLRVLSGGSAIGEGFARGAVDDAVEPTRLRRVGGKGGKCSGKAEAQGKQGNE